MRFGDTALGPSVLDITNISGVSSHIATLGPRATDIQALGPQASAIQNLGPQATNIGTLAPYAANIGSLSGITSEIQTVAADINAITTVNTNIASVNSVSTNISDVNLLATNMSTLNAIANNAPLQINALSDVDTTGLNTGNLLKYDGTDFVPTAGFGQIALGNAAANVSDSGITSGQGLKYDGTNYVPEDFVIGPVVDALNSTSTTTALSARQGKELKALIDGLGSIVPVADMTARNALTGLSVGDLVHVIDNGSGEWARWQVTSTTDGTWSNSTTVATASEAALASQTIVSSDANNSITAGADSGAFFQERTAQEIADDYEALTDRNQFTDTRRGAVDDLISGVFGDHYTNMNVSGVASGDFLFYDGANWSNRTSESILTHLGLADDSVASLGHLVLGDNTAGTGFTFVKHVLENDETQGGLASAEIQFSDSVSATVGTIRYTHANASGNAEDSMFFRAGGLSTGIFLDGLTDTTTPRVGIGTNTPAAALDVSGAIKSSSSISNSKVGMTVNDSYGNASLAFNHVDGTPSIDGNSGRIVVNTDVSGNADFQVRLASSVTSGVAVSPATVMDLDEGNVSFRGTVKDGGADDSMTSARDVRLPKQFGGQTTLTEPGVYYRTNNTALTIGAVTAGAVFTIYNNHNGNVTLNRGSTVTTMRIAADNTNASGSNKASVTLEPFTTTTITIFNGVFAVVSGTGVS